MITPDPDPTLSLGIEYGVPYPKKCSSIDASLFFSLFTTFTNTTPSTQVSAAYVKSGKFWCSSTTCLRVDEDPSGLWKYLSGLKFRYPEMSVAATVLNSTDNNSSVRFLFITHYIFNLFILLFFGFATQIICQKFLYLHNCQHMWSGDLPIAYWFYLNDEIMKFIVSSTDLLQGLLSVQKVIASKSSLPILDNFLFVLDGNTLTVTGSDAETTLKTILTINEVMEGGEIAVPAKLLTDSLKELPTQPIEFAADKERNIVNIIWARILSSSSYVSTPNALACLHISTICAQVPKNVFARYFKLI